MTQQEFEATIQQRREEYNAKRDELKQQAAQARELLKAACDVYAERKKEIDKELSVINAEYHAGNLTLHNLVPKADREKKIKEAGFNIQRCIKHKIEEWEALTKYLNTAETVCQFNIDDFGIHVTLEIPRKAEE